MIKLCDIINLMDQLWATLIIYSDNILSCSYTRHTSFSSITSSIESVSVF